jgi:HEAT repeat protein
MSRVRYVCVLLLLSSVAAAATVDARQQSQAKGTAGQKPAAGQDEPALVVAREALVAGRSEEAVGRANEVLGREPGNRGAAEIAIVGLLAQGKREQALTTYDIHTTARRQADSDLLRTIARSDLRGVSQQHPDLGTRSLALEALAADGDSNALRALKQLVAAQTQASLETVGPILSLARLGDAEGVARLAAFATSVSYDTRAQALQVVATSGVRGVAGSLVPLLDDREPRVQGAAARALGRLGYSGAVPRLQAMFESEAPEIKMSAAIALKQLGQKSADVYLAGFMKSPVPEVRLLVGEAYSSTATTQWAASIRELLSDKNEVIRVRAARVIARADPASARRTLLAALDSPNALLRNEAARALDDVGLADAQTARRLLGDSSEAFRVRGAASALRAAQRK